ncbi:MAG: class I SAM-dependent methyltransferase [Halobacteriota archaeon]
MPHTEPFDRYTDRYEEWFAENEYAYRSEVAALRRLIPSPGRGVEIGVGTGRFADPLGVRYGLDPSVRMLRRAADRGIEVVAGVAEDLPLAADSFDTALVVTAICFVDDVGRTLREARRVLVDGGRLVIGYIDKESPVGQLYQEHKTENPFYRDATFVSTEVLLGALRSAGFDGFETVQTIFEPPTELTELDSVTEGYGEGSFVGIAARA